MPNKADQISSTVDQIVKARYTGEDHFTALVTNLIGELVLDKDEDLQNAELIRIGETEKLQASCAEKDKTLKLLRDEIEPMARQIIDPKENTFTRQLKAIAEALSDRCGDEFVARLKRAERDRERIDILAHYGLGLFVRVLRGKFVWFGRSSDARIVTGEFADVRDVIDWAQQKAVSK